MKQVYLQNQRIKLRAVEPEDSHTVWEVENDTAQWFENCMAAPLSEQVVADYAIGYDADPYRAGQLRLIVEQQHTGTILGIVDLYEISALHRHAFIGIYIIPEFRRQGYGAESLKLTLEYAFSILNIIQIGAKIVIDNEESINLFKKCGFSQCGILPNWLMSGNKTTDLLLFCKTSVSGCQSD